MDKKETQQLFKGPWTMKNRDRRLLALADRLDKCKSLTLAKARETFRSGKSDGTGQNMFTMETFQYPCSSPACLVGHGLALADWETLHKPFHFFGQAHEAFMEIYGVGNLQAKELFAPGDTYRWDYAPDSGHAYYITPKHAAAVLREFVETGEVDWDGVGERLERAEG